MTRVPDHPLAARFAAYDHLPQPVWCSDEAGANVYVNQRFVALSGMSAEALLGFGFVDALHAEDRERALRVWHASRQDGLPYECEYRLRRADGEYRWVRALGEPVLGENAGLLYWVGTLHDIHTLKCAEERAASLLELTGALAGAPDQAGVVQVILNVGARVTAAHAAGLALLSEDGATLEFSATPGYGPELLNAWRHAARSAPVPVAQAARAGQSLFYPSRAELVAHCPHLATDSEGVEAQASAFLPLGANGRVLGALVLDFARPRDFDAAERAFLHTLAGQCAQALERARLHDEERALQTERDRADQARRALLEALPQIIWESDASGQIQRFNARWQDLTGLPTVPAGTSWMQAVHPEDRERVSRVRRRGLQSGQAYDFEVRYRLRDGTYRAFASRVTPLGPPGAPSGWVGSSTDIHEREAAEARLALLAEAGETLAQDLDVDETLARLTALAVPRLGDWCAVHLPQDDGTLRPLAVRHRDPEKLEVARQFAHAFPVRDSDHNGVGRVFREAAPLLVPDITGAVLSAPTLREEQRAVMQTLELRSLLVVPMVAHGRVLGVLSLNYAESGRVYRDEDLPFALELARRAALALDNARLYAEVRGRNADLEAGVAARTRELAARNAALEAFAELSRDLALESDPEKLVGRAQEILLSLLPPGVSNYFEPDGPRWRFVSHRGEYRNSTLLASLRAGLPRGQSRNLDEPFVTRAPLYQERYDPATTAVAPEHTRDFGATAALPVLVSGRPRGVLVVGLYHQHAWSAAERAVLETFARNLGLALERARALRDLAGTERRLRAVVDHAPVVLFALDSGGVFTLSEGRGLQALGLTPGQAVGQSAFKLYEGAPAVPANLRRALSGEEVHAVQWVAGRAFESWYVPVRGEDAAVTDVVGVASDITERFEAQAHLERANAELARSNAELEQFAYVASHDLQAPLRAVTSFADVLARHLGDGLDDRARSYLRHIVEGGQHMKRLVDDLLAFSRLHTEQRSRQPTSADHALDDVLRRLRPQIEALRAEVTRGELPRVLADAGQLDQVWQNLIDNALKYHRDGVAPRVHVSAARDGDLWRFSVADNGIGIEEQYFERRAHLRDFSAPAPARALRRHRHRPGGVQKDRGAPRRTPLGGEHTRKGQHLLFHLARRMTACGWAVRNQPRQVGVRGRSRAGRAAERLGQML